MQKLMKAIHKNQKGFTLVELMVVVVIIGILVAIAIPLMATVTANAEARACQANQRTIDGATTMWYAADPTNTGAPSLADLAPYIVDSATLACPTGGTVYTPGAVDAGALTACPDVAANADHAR